MYNKQNEHISIRINSIISYVQLQPIVKNIKTYKIYIYIYILYYQLIHNFVNEQIFILSFEWKWMNVLQIQYFFLIIINNYRNLILRCSDQSVKTEHIFRAQNTNIMTLIHLNQTPFNQYYKRNMDIEYIYSRYHLSLSICKLKLLDIE